jgi:uncharacterized membrane protein
LNGSDRRRYPRQGDGALNAQIRSELTAQNVAGDWVQAFHGPHDGRLRFVTGPFRWLAQHRALCLIVFCSFAARLPFASLTSLWYDDFLSIIMYGTNHATLGAALRELAEQSAHPPLYHVVLFEWMRIFGDTELATRTLSNLYIAGATVCLYALAFELFGRRVAIASVLIFAFSYTATFYANEVRSYAQSLFLVTLSSLLLLRWIEQLDATQPWRCFFTGRGLALFLCNGALLLTHYSNLSFVVVQALFAGVVLWHRARPTDAASLVKTAVFYLSQVATAFAIWGPFALATGKRFQGNAEFAIQRLPTKSPLRVLMNFVIKPNFNLPAILYVILLVLLCAVLAKVVSRYWKRSTGAPLNAYFLFYLVAWAILPSIVIYLCYFISRAERYEPRYFAFCFPPFCILLVLAVEQLVESLNAAGRMLRLSVSRHYLRNATLYALVFCAVFALPGAYDAATTNKRPFRDIARAIVMLVEGDKDSSFAIYEATNRSPPMLNYYMKQFSKTVRVDGTFQQGDEEVGRDGLAGAEKVSTEKDYLVIAFPHLRTVDFPNLMRRLDEEYTLVISQLSEGRGFAVFKRRALKSLP